MHYAAHPDADSERLELMHDNWTYLKDPVQRRWQRLNEESLAEIDGDCERLLDRIQVAYGIHREQAQTELEAFMDEYAEYFELVRDRSPGTPFAPRPHL